MKSSYLTAGIRIKPLIRLLRSNPVSFRIKYLGRILFLFQAAFWSSVFACVDRLRYGKTVKNQALKGDPVFIVGHWRTGSTYLHQLLGKDPAFTTPTLLQVALPDSFLSSSRYFRPVFKIFVGKKRPMDNVRLGVEEPQEDEYAIYRMNLCSPLVNLVFPRRKGYFLKENVCWIPGNQAIDEWSGHLVDFYKKITYLTQRRILSKNPFNSMRVPCLAKLFPGSLFIHITRDPLEVVPSTIHMWDIVQQQNLLNRNHYRPQPSEVSEVMAGIEKQLKHDLDQLEQHRVARVRYEDLLRDPLGEIRQIYATLGLDFTEAFRSGAETRLRELSTFERNRFTLNEEERTVIKMNLKDYNTAYGYDQE